ncbi:unnamed protein product [Zymoseptoria tritici ST99CH_1A5]|uniref:Uncharacterized protein n=4 Tax=Zymoseptoria tritici TaxID=1047171 RepID=F9X448_ZYMTI|nr:uncharacterized protein MYCGRDRAFT_90465 [Zymoseptoria tritici IPO323]SMQ47258.1 unnamed protein product [Zymoseptoria tritici ST99CH_3D7]SMR45787.1 unnamed protein product [Zymoseptoria tritici ST99CH_1E4]SMR47040.1 unnamed protein product [Zymoseptoria tritici ST99CH_3D1]SMY20941.1 unnamed protein product [Zymoseptoria tritici ST99CH_1A5]EGP89760.1 hypothetical protein MYCGRDRAFT_90465 [Zymoseptoria tritici IPO323]
MSEYSATERVLAIPELLENVLLQLGSSDDTSWKQLFVVQRVSSTFDAVIKSSTQLRRAMHLERRRQSLATMPTPILPADAVSTLQNGIDAARPACLARYQQFFYSLEKIIYPFWCNLRISSGPKGTVILHLNVSLFWSEELAGSGTVSARVPSTLDGSNPVEKLNSWRNLLVPYDPLHPVEVHCCGSKIIDTCGAKSTLGELADEAIRAGRGHLKGVKQMVYHQQ